MAQRRLALAAAVVLLASVVAGAHASAPDVANARYAAAPAQEMPGWQQVNTNGFGDQLAVEVTALEVFGGHLYAGTANPASGARVYRSADGVTWGPVSQPGFGVLTDTRPPAILDLVVFGGRLYAGTGRNDNAGQIWRSLDGLTWAPMVIAGFGEPDSVDITALAVYNGAIYAGVANLINGAQIWRSLSGDNNTWTRVAPSVPGTSPAAVTGFAAYGGALYAAVESDSPAQIWSTTGVGWNTLMDDGFGSSLTTSTGGMAEFAGYLYVGAGNGATGAQLWRTNDGTTWEPAIVPGFGDPNNDRVEEVFVFQNLLYASVHNVSTGMELWRTMDGALWKQVNFDGFGDGNNTGSNRGNAAAAFLGSLYLGTSNAVNGGEAWRMLPQRRLFPVVLR